MFDTGIGLGLTFGRSNNGGSLGALFANGEEGFLFSAPEDTGALFTTSAGAANIATNDDPVGLALDGRQWSGVPFSTFVASQPDVISNPGNPFAATTGYTGYATSGTAPTLSIVGGRMRVTYSASDTSIGKAVIVLSGLTVGATYRFAGVGDKGTFVTMTWRVTTDSAGLSLGQVFAENGDSVTQYFVATAATMYAVAYSAATSGNAGQYFEVSSISVKHVPGTHASQPTSSARPLYKTNSSRPYLNFDGTDDYLLVDADPFGAGTMAVAFRGAVTSTMVALGGGTTTGNKRARLGLNASGYPEFSFNDQFSAPVSTDYSSSDLVMVQTWGGGQRRCYIDDTLVLDEARMANFDGAGSGFALGRASGEGAGAYLAGRIYGALYIDRIASPGEIKTLIVPQLRGLYQ